MNNTQLYIENIGVGLIDVNNLHKLDLHANEYLVVGQRNNETPISMLDNEYNLVVNNNGVGINATRRDMKDTNAGLLVNNNIICKGTVIAKSIQFENFTFDSNITEHTLSTLIKTVNSNLLFFNGYSNNLINNIYTPNYLTIGNYDATFSNAHPLKISDSPNGSADNIQLAIYNNINNDTEPAKFSFGMMGYNQYSPANIITTEGMPLVFHISKPSTFIDNLYSNGTGLPAYNSNNYPNIAIDINGCVNINKDNCDNTIVHNEIIRTPILNVNGYAIISNLGVYDYYNKGILHLDDIYIRKNGLTLKANQIKGGDFVDEVFTFNSNVNIGKSSNFFELNVNGSATITKTLNTNTLNAYKTNINGIADFNKTAYFNNVTVFNDNITIDKSLNINNDLFINGIRVSLSNLDYANNQLNYDTGCNLSISGRFGTGVLNTDTYDHQFNIIKRNKERFELYIQDVSGITTDSSRVYMGHTNLNNLNGSIDNSFVILTQKNIKWHNIYFYAGKDKDGTNALKNMVPNLAIMENNRIGINTNLPQKTFDVIGEIIAKDYYIRKNNIEYKLNYITIANDGSSVLNVTNLNINLVSNNYLNKKTLNIGGGINSYDGYFENNYKLATFKIYPTIATTFNNIGIGIIETNNSYTIPLQVRNTSTNINNNTVIRLYRGVKGGGFNNNSLYTGIDFCDYDMPIKTQNKNNYKWFIYKNNTNNNATVGPLQIGYTDNSYNPTHSCMNFYYNSTNKKYFIDINNPIINHNYNTNNAVSIKGNIEIEGNINLKGDNSCYMINGAIIGSFSNPAVLQTLSSSTNTYYTDNINDISLLGNKILLLPKKTTVISYNDDWIFNKINTFELNNNNTPLFIYNNKDYTDDNIPPIITKFYNKSYKNYTSRPDIANIEIGIISDNSDEGNINNKVNMMVKGYESELTIFEITPNDTNPFITFISQNNKNQVNIGNGVFYSSNIVNYTDTCLHINDDFDCLLRLTNNTKPVKMSLLYDNNHKWDLIANSNLSFNYNNNSLFNINNDGVFTFNNNNTNINNSSSFNIHSIVNKSSMEITNYYYNDYINPDNSFETSSFIALNIDNVNYTISDFHDDNYDDNFDNNITNFVYKINDSNLPIINVNNESINNYFINNSNVVFNSNIKVDIITTINNIELDYKYLENINVYNDSNTIELIPTLKTFNPDLNASIISFNVLSFSYDIDNVPLNINYKIPHTLDEEQLFINSDVSYINFYSNYDSNYYYNVSLNTFLKVKDKPLFDYNIKTTTDIFTVNYNDNNYNYNITNTIYYYPLPNITVRTVELNIKYLYNYENSIVLPKNFYNNYENTIEIANISSNSNIITLNNSNLYLSEYIIGNDIYNPVDAINFRKVKLLSSNTINKLYPIEINNVDVCNIILTFTKNNYFEMYDFENNNPIINIPITTNSYKPHLILKNYNNSQYSALHKIYSYNNNFELHLDDNKLIGIDSNGNLNSLGSITTTDLYFTGDIYNKIGNSNISITSNLMNIIGNNFYIQKQNISLNSSNIFLNPSIINNGGIIINGSDVHTTNNLFQINNFIDDDNFIVLKSISSSSYINFFNIDSLYKVGVKNGSFGIWRSINNDKLNTNYIDNNLDTFDNVISFNYENNSNLLIDINGNIKTTNHFSINNMTTYIDNSYDYKVRVHGNMKVDGVVMSSSDKRLKNNIYKIEGAMEKLEKLTGVSYYYNEDCDNHKHIGLIAQEVKAVIPEVVYEDERGYLNIAYGNLLGLVIEAIKELKNEMKK